MIVASSSSCLAKIHDYIIVSGRHSLFPFKENVSLKWSNMLWNQHSERRIAHSLCNKSCMDINDVVFLVYSRLFVCRVRSRMRMRRWGAKLMKWATYAGRADPVASASTSSRLSSRHPARPSVCRILPQPPGIIPESHSELGKERRRGERESERAKNTRRHPTSPRLPAPAQQGEEDAQVQARPCVPIELDNKKRTTTQRKLEWEFSFGTLWGEELILAARIRLNDYTLRRVMHLNREEDNSSGE